LKGINAMGRPAKSDSRHWLDGSKSQAKNGPPAFVGGRPRLPKHLCTEAKAEFKRCVQLLENRGTLTPSDETSLAIYAEVYSRWIQAKREIGKELMIETTVTDNNGNPRIVRRLNPLLKVATECEARLLALAKSLGLTQVDIGRCKTTAIDAVNEIVPGSVRDTHPELFDAAGNYVKPQQKEPIVFTPLVPNGEEHND
jgi:P27 family predicted phage terminase small subunit